MLVILTCCRVVVHFAWIVVWCTWMFKMNMDSRSMRGDMREHFCVFQLPRQQNWKNRYCDCFLAVCRFAVSLLKVSRQMSIDSSVLELKTHSCLLDTASIGKKPKFCAACVIAQSVIKAHTERRDRGRLNTVCERLLT